MIFFIVMSPNAPVVPSARREQLVEVRYQASIMADEDAIRAIDEGRYDGMLPQQGSDLVWTSIYDDLCILKIAGMQYRGNLKAYIGEFKGVLVPEPKNEYDPYAIMVKCEDGKHLGYIREEETDIVRQMVGVATSTEEERPTSFPPYRIHGRIDLVADAEGGDPFYTGVVYIRKRA